VTIQQHLTLKIKTLPIHWTATTRYSKSTTTKNKWIKCNSHWHR